MHSFQSCARSCLAIVAGLSLASAAMAQKSHQFDFSTSITIPAGAPAVSNGPASIYPAAVAVSGVNAPIGEVKVVLRGLTHTWSSDLDMLLVGPNGQAAILANRVGSNGPGVSNFNFVLTQDGNAFPIYGVPPSGRYRPTLNPSYPPAFNAPAPAGPYGASLDVFKGTAANGTWSLYIMDNSVLDVGSLTGWSLIIDEAKSFANEAPMSLPAGQPVTTVGPASLYPSSLVVDGLEGQVRSVRVMLAGITHSYQSDLRFMLQGPSGQTCLLYSNCGDSTDWTANDLIFDDNSPFLLPAGAPAGPGTYHPSQCVNGGTSFAAPAPAAPYGTALSVFNGTNPNGVWSLWAADTVSGDIGQMAGGWALVINGQTCPANYNKDGVLSVNDIFDFLNGWFAGCP